MRILDIFLDKSKNHICGKYSDNEVFFNALKNEETDAIRCLFKRVSSSVLQIGKNQLLSADDIEELICDCITLCIQKLRDGKYVFQNYDPATFVIEIAKNKARNFRRNLLKYQTADIEQIVEKPEESESSSQEDLELLESLLSRLEANCQKLIRLKYLDERRDIEVIDEQLTQYTTVNALKNHRSKCMKKLVSLRTTISTNRYN